MSTLLPPSQRLVVAAPLRIEATALRRGAARLRVVRTGMGAARARRAAETLAETEAGARAIAEALGTRIRGRLGDAVYSTNGEPLDATVAGMLRERRIRIASAESCTGGLLAAKLSKIPGSSEYFAGGFVSYSESAKCRWLGVDDGLLEACGAVSAEAAAAMAEAARQRALETAGGPAIGVATTGFAGPGGGTGRDPVGTVYFGIADEGGTGTVRRQLGRGRGRVRTLAVQLALDLVRRRVRGLDTGVLRAR